ncbi:amidase [Friedmanniella luteola]|uniref:Amidase n=1 Tax=Friedmanniella luteola TaxID=546871 RepID=A0A1H1M176_9ACTN|nr:amidase family protein [Friedmanniella luteola]SDR80608.1 amidase [Friedmanniella luteola]
MTDTIDRRRFLELGAGGLTALAVGSTVVLPAGATVDTAGVAQHTRRHPGAPWFETDIGTLQRWMRRGRVTSAGLTAGFLARIAELNPVLHAVIETNPDALRIARRRDAERRAGHLRGPLHGIPVLVKDNIATDDRMETTAGSLALVGSEVPADAPLVRQLRRAGAVVLGKANLSEWANFRGFDSINGWSARGGFTRNPYDLGLDPSGSSSGSAAAVAAGLSVVAVGTETDGSILSPAGEQSIVGLKPTVGLVSGRGIIPIAASQDTAGPMARTVRDAALLLDTLRVPGRRVLGHRVPRSYAEHLDRRGLRHARLAYDLRYVTGDYGPGDEDALALTETVLRRLRRAGAVVEEVTSLDPAQPDASGRIPLDDEFTVLLFEFKVQIQQYLSTLRNTDLRTLADLIAFNRAQCGTELAWFGQEVFELAEATSGDLRDPGYRAAKATSQAFGRGVIDGYRRQGFDAVLTPSNSFATSVAATAGYPSLSVPIGFVRETRPVGLWMAAGCLEEPALLGLGHAVEQLLQARERPTLAGTVPPLPDPFNGCQAPAPQADRSRTAAAPTPARRRRTW